jgi:hypothetical protein
MSHPTPLNQFEDPMRHGWLREGQGECSKELLPSWVCESMANFQEWISRKTSDDWQIYLNGLSANAPALKLQPTQRASEITELLPHRRAVV